MVIKTVIEGIEKRSQLDSIMEIDIDMIQGYYLFRSLSVKDFKKYLDDYEKTNNYKLWEYSKDRAFKNNIRFFDYEDPNVE